MSTRRLGRLLPASLWNAADAPPREDRLSGGFPERTYFPELDGIRFFAFFLVFLFHGGIIPFTKWVSDLRRTLLTLVPGYVLPRDLGFRVQNNGWIGVQVFFVLSGFLIATILLREEGRYGRIDLRAFWARRILRIWPLYYLTMLLAFLALPLLEGMLGDSGFRGFARKQVGPFLLFLGNWSMALLGPPPTDSISILWSVCVEEQFYLFFPLLLVLTPRGLRVPLVLALMGLSIFGRYNLAREGANSLRFQYSSIVHLDTLLSGVLLALLFDRYPPGALAARIARIVQVPLLILFAALLLKPNLAHGPIDRRTWDFVSIWACSAGLIAVVVAHDGWLRRALGYSRLAWLGKISYGLYMFHVIAIWLGRKLFGSLGWVANGDILQSILAFALTVGLAALSYQWFERFFLRRKERWTRVPSRPV